MDSPPLSGRDLLAKLRQTVRETPPAAVADRWAAQENFLLVDVRESDEYRNGFIPGAHHVPRGFLEMKIESVAPDRATKIVLYCAGGNRSLLAAETLSRMGYRHVESMVGGFAQWAREGRAVEKPVPLDEAARRRYARHLRIPEIGEAGQAKFLAAKILLVGAGGLGSPVALYLAAAGIGTLGLVDDDIVDESNLQRQILHPTSSVGIAKVASAVRTLSALNPGVRLRPFQERLTADNVDCLLADFDLVVDGSDNFTTRYLVSDACVKHGKPYVHGSIFRFEGQVAVFDTRAGGPCYRCLYPAAPSAEEAPNCAEAGVLGVLPGVIGLLQATETLKLVGGFGQSLAGRLLTYDALAARFREFEVRRDPACRAEHPAR